MPVLYLYRSDWRLGNTMTWLHGQVISTLGNTFCHTSHLKPRHERYEMLPTDLFNLWSSSLEGHIASQTSLSFHFKQAASLLNCCTWLIPMLHKHHWYLLTFNWVDCYLHLQFTCNSQPRSGWIWYRTIKDNCRGISVWRSGMGCCSWASQ